MSNSEVASQLATYVHKKTYDVVIAGMPYKLKTFQDEATVAELVSFINEKMDQALAATKNGSFQSAAILTAINLAEELVVLKKKALKELDRIEEKTLRLASDLESSRLDKTKA